MNPEVVENSEQDQNIKTDETTFLENLTDCFNITISSFGFLIGFYPMYDKIEPAKRTP